MPRQLEFDRTRALERAMKVFWSRGYTATSLAQLLDAMQIARSSFYATFSDKRTLFIECLDLFARRTAAILDHASVRAEPEKAPAYFFDQTLFCVSRQRAWQGCMMVNAILELAEVDAELGRLAAQRLQLVEQRFEALFDQARKQGRLQTDVSPAALAQYIMNVNQGLRVQSRKRLPPEELRMAVDTSLSIAGLATLAQLAADSTEKGVQHVQ